MSQNAGVGGQVERRLGVARLRPRRGRRRPATRPPPRCRRAAAGRRASPARGRRGRAGRSAAEVVELGEPEAGGVDRRRRRRRQRPASRRSAVCPASTCSSISGGGGVPVRSQDSRARSTASPWATTKPIAASMSTMAVTLPTACHYPIGITAVGVWRPSGRRSVPSERLRHGQYDGQRRVDLLDPGDDAALDVHRVGEAGRLERGERLGRADAGLAVQHDLLVLRAASASASPERISPLGISVAPGIWTISYSAGSRTSTRKMSLPASSQSLQLAAR